MAKPSRVVFLLSVLSIQAFGQGTIVFDNRRLIGANGFYDAPVMFPDGTRVAGTAFTAGLFIVEPTGLRLASTTTFRDTPNGLGLFIPSVVTLEGVPAQSSTIIRIRVGKHACSSGKP